MNIHPLVVHFPIACLVLYSIIECISFLHKGFREKFAVTKIVLLVIGVLSAFVALQTGEIAEQTMGRSEHVHMHSEYAEITYQLYMILLILYFISREVLAIRFSHPILVTVGKVFAMLQKYGIIALVALIAMILLSITGALGGAIVYGPNADPIVSFVYNLLLK